MVQALLLHLLVYHLINHEESGALWIDTSGDFSTERASQVMHSLDAKVVQNLLDLFYFVHFVFCQGVITVLDRLQLSLAFDIAGVYDIFESMQSTANASAQISYVLIFYKVLVQSANIRCVVIDAITPLLGPLLSAVSFQGHAIMTDFMRQLRTLARSLSLTIFV